MLPGSLIASLLRSLSLSLSFIFRAMPLSRWSQHQLIEVISQRQIHAVFPAVRLSFPILCALAPRVSPLGCPSACPHAFVCSSLIKGHSPIGSAGCPTSYRVDSRDLPRRCWTRTGPVTPVHVATSIILGCLSSAALGPQLPRGERPEVPLRE